MKKNKKSKKWWIFIIVCIIIIIALLIYKGNKNKTTEQNGDTGSEKQMQNEYTTIQEDGTKVNTSSKLSETKILEGLEISNIKLTEKDNATEIIADIKNTTNKEVEGFYTLMTFLDKDGKTIVQITGYIPTIEANGKGTLNTKSGDKFSNAYDIKIVKAEQ